MILKLDTATPLMKMTINYVIYFIRANTQYLIFFVELLEIIIDTL